MLELYHNDMSTFAQKMRFDEERVISQPLIQKSRQVNSTSSA
jgi:hypothetical protein